ncbi:hypothetical protein Dimus_017231 [Dionaea muscipula]
MARPRLLMHEYLLIGACLIPLISAATAASLRPDFYAETCPDVEKFVRKAVKHKIKHNFAAVPATLHLYFQDCFGDGCDASLMIQSQNSSLGRDGFDTVFKAKAAIDRTPGCKNKVSCADILAMATRDAINLAGGPFYRVELGRFDSLPSTGIAKETNGKGSKSKSKMMSSSNGMNTLDELTALFAIKGLSQVDMIALSGAHTIGSAHCSKFVNRIYNFSESSKVDPSLNPQYAVKLQAMCPRDHVDPNVVVKFDPVTPYKFDNAYFQNLINGMGLLSSDQVLFTDQRSRPIIVDWARNAQHFYAAFVQAITRMGRVGVKSSQNGNIRVKCDAFN